MKRNALIVATTAMLTFASACGDTPTLPSGSLHGPGDPSADKGSSHLVRYASSKGEIYVDADKGVILDARGKAYDHPLADSVVRRIRSNEQAELWVAALEKKLGKDSVYQRRVAHAIKAASEHGGGAHGSATPLFAIQDGELCTDALGFPMDCGDAGAIATGGSAGAGSGSGSLCEIKGYRIYQVTQLWHAARDELNKAWIDEGLDLAALAGHVAEGNVAGAALDTANLLKDDLAIAHFQMEVDTFYNDLTSAAKDYYASGC